MKKYIKFAFLAVASLIVVSCKDFLDRMPTTSLPSTKAIENYTDAVTALNGIYDGLQSTSYTGGDMIYYGDMLGDYYQISEKGQRGEEFYGMYYTAAASSSIWLYPYNSIRQANNLLKAIADGKVPDGTKEAIADLRGQALTVRALDHFNLVRVYGKPYTKDGGIGYGVPIELAAESPQHKPGRNTVAEVYTAIIDDLNNAIAEFTTAGATKPTAKNAYINIWGAKALLARVYLYQGDNDKAFTVAKDIIDNGPYTLVSNADYKGSWAYNAPNSELIFQVVRTPDDGAGDRENIGYLAAEDGYGAFVVSKKLRAILDTRPNDVRNTILIPSVADKNILIFGNAKVWLTKYGAYNGNYTVTNVPLFRLSEVYLIAAEAGLKSGAADKAFANTCLNAIAKRANPEAAELALTIDNILLEKGIEMVGEGERFFDLMRNDKQCDRTIRWPYVFSPDAQGSISFDNGYFRIVLPIPLSEINANPTLEGQQNPGYN